MGRKLHECLRHDGTHYSWAFYCPACQSLHQCDDRWPFNGDQDRPTFVGSVLVHEVKPTPDSVPGYAGRPRCHSFVTDGRISYCPDSTHAMAGQAVDLPDWDSVREPYG